MLNAAVNSGAIVLLLFGLFSPISGLLVYYAFTFLHLQHFAYSDFGIPYARLAVLATVVGWLAMREKRSLPMHPALGLLGCLLVWMIFSSLTARLPSLAWPLWLDFLKIAFSVVLTAALLTNRLRLHAFVWMVVLSIGFYAAKGGLYTIVTAGGGDVVGPPSSQLATNNGLSRGLVMTLPLVVYLALHSELRWVRLGFYAAGALFLIALLGTDSRGGQVAFAAMLVVFWLRSRRKLALMVLGMILIGSVVAMLPTQRLDLWVERITTVGQEETFASEESFAGRIWAWKLALRIAGDNPLTGGGFQAYRAYPYQIDAAGRVVVKDWHNNYFEMLGEHGYVGLAIYLGLIAVVMNANRRTRIMTRDRPDLFWARDMAILMNIAIIGYLVGGLTISHANFELFYAFVGATVALHAVARREIAQSAVPRAALAARA